MKQKHPLNEADLDDFEGDDEFEGDFDDDDEDFDDDDDLDEDFDNETDFDDAEDDDEEDDDEDDVPAPADDDDDDDEDVHPSDVEADLEEILRDRIAASDDDDDDEDDGPAPVKPTTVVAPPRSDEWTCNQCFLIVSVSQFGSRSAPVCPSGEDPCESIIRVLSG